MFTILAEKFCDNFHSSKKLPSVVSATRAAWCQHSCACAGYDWVQSGEIDALIAPDSYLLPYMARPPCNTQVVGPYFGIGSMALAVPLNSTLLTRINTVSAIHPSPDLQFFNQFGCLRCCTPERRKHWWGGRRAEGSLSFSNPYTLL